MKNNAIKLSWFNLMKFKYLLLGFFVCSFAAVQSSQDLSQRYSSEGKIVEHRLQYGNNFGKWRQQVVANPLFNDPQKQDVLKKLDQETASRLMGIELETPDLKVKYDPKSPAGFVFFRHGEAAWFLEEDTFDDKNVASEYRNNLECRSVGGFKRLGVDLVIDEMGLVLRAITRQCMERDPFPFGQNRVSEIIGPNVSLVNKNPHQDWFWTKLKDSKKITGDIDVRPQITYQVKLGDINPLFARLKELRHKDVSKFLEDISTESEQSFDRAHEQFRTTMESQVLVPSGDPYDNAVVSAKVKLLSLDESKKALVAQFFKSKVHRLLQAITDDKLKSFATLFLFYWHELFNSCQKLGTEAGLKQFLGIMSRVPLSQIFHSCLSEQEKIVFSRIFGSLIEEWGDCFKLRFYTREDEHGANIFVDQAAATGKSGLVTLKDWYHSIIRVPLPQDMLSPPPGLLPIDNRPYAMGAMDIDQSNKMPIVEVRGYNSVFHGNIDSVLEKVHKEAEWFFSNIVGG